MCCNADEWSPVNLRQLVKRSPLASLAAFPYRARTVTSYEWHQARRSWAWLVGSREYTNFTYELTTENVVEMAWFVAAVTGLGFDETFGYVEELHNDQALLDHLRRAAANSPLCRVMDPEPRYGRRAAWYAIVRATRPQHVVETGVDKGLGLCVCCRATSKRGRGSPWSLDRARHQPGCWRTDRRGVRIGHRSSLWRLDRHAGCVRLTGRLVSP